MHPVNVPLNGPSSSFNSSQDRLAVSGAIKSLYTKINAQVTVIDPEGLVITLPTLPRGLEVSLPAGTLSFQGQNNHFPGRLTPLSVNTDTYFDIVNLGVGSITDFAPGALLYISSGAQQGSYRTTLPTITSISPIDISNGQILSMNWTGTFLASAGWGPSFFNNIGQGYIIRTLNGTGTLSSAVQFLPNQTLAALNTNTAAATGSHQFLLNMTYLGPGSAANTFQYHIQLYIDGSVTPIVDYMDLTSPLNPGSVYPAITSDSNTTIYLNDWEWYINGKHPMGWNYYNVPVGNAPPPARTDGKRIFMISCGPYQPLILRVLIDVNTLSNRIAALRAKISALQGAYF